MGQATQPTTFPGQGQPGTGPGQKGQEPQHQSEHGLQPIKDHAKTDCEEVNQARQNQDGTAQGGDHRGANSNTDDLPPRDPDQSGVGMPEDDPQQKGAF